MKYLTVTRWKDYQAYKNRRAPWIKAHTDILDASEHPKFAKLTDGAKLTLHHLRLLAGVTGNRIPEKWLNSAHLNMQTKPRVTELLEADFVAWDIGEFASEPVDTSLASTGPDASGARGRVRSQNSPISPSSLTEEDEKPIRASARELIESFVVTESHRAWAATKVPGVDVDAATDAWRDHNRTINYRTRQGPVSDADASWRNWMRNEVKFSRGNHGRTNTPSGPDNRQPTARDLGMRSADEVLAAIAAKR